MHSRVTFLFIFTALCKKVGDRLQNAKKYGRLLPRPRTVAHLGDLENKQYTTDPKLGFSKPVSTASYDLIISIVSEGHCCAWQYESS
jgi:hypothetical protein